MGVPTASNNWGNCDPSEKKNYRTRCSALISSNNYNTLIDTSNFYTSFQSRLGYGQVDYTSAGTGTMTGIPDYHLTDSIRIENCVFQRISVINNIP